MIHSMTGYSLNSSQIAQDFIIIEIRCLNSKHFDFSFKAPEIFFQIENEVRKIVKKKLIRGKIELKVKKNNFKNSNNEIINDIKSKIDILKNISPQTSKEKLIHLALLTPRSSQMKLNKISEKYKNFFLTLLNQSIDDVNTFRSKEGASLQKELVK